MILEHQANITTIKLNRPEKLNALNAQLIEELALVIRKCEEDEGTRAVVINGGSRVFGAGADIEDVQRLGGVFAGYRIAKSSKSCILRSRICPNL